MSDTRAITNCRKLEAILHDSTADNLYGDPPADLVQRALDLYGCKSTTGMSLPIAHHLIVMSVAAAFLLVASAHAVDETGAASGITGKPRVEAGVSTDVTVVPTQATVTSPAAVTFLTTGAVTKNANSLTQAANYSWPRLHSKKRYHSQIASIKPHSTSSLWRDTVVTTREQGIIVPIIRTSTDSEIQEGMPAEVTSGVAVVAVSSDTTYTEYSQIEPK